MATQDLASFAGAEKEFYEKQFKSLLNRKVVLYDRIKRSAEGRTQDGKYYVFSTHIRTGWSAGSRAAGGLLPEARNEDYVQGKVYNKRHYVSVEIDGESEALTDTDAGAWVKVKPESIKRKAETMAQNMNRMFYNGGRGILAECASYAAPTVTIRGYGASTSYDNDDGWAWDTNKHFHPGMPIAWGRANTAAATEFTSAGGAAGGYGTVLAVSTTSPFNTFTITKLGGDDPAANDVFVIGDGLLATQHSYNQESPGLNQIVKEADDNFEGIDTGDYPEWKAREFNSDSSGNTRPLSESLMQRPYDYVNDKSSAGYPDVILTHTSMIRMYIEMMRAKGGERYAPTKWSGGVSKKDLTFNGGAGDTALVGDKDAPHREMKFISMADITLFQARPFEWDTSNGGVWKHKAGYDATYAFAKTYCTLGTRNRRAHARLNDLTVTGLDY